jgi:hypothetical protein
MNLPLFLKRVAKVRTFFEVPNFSAKIFKKKSIFLKKVAKSPQNGPSKGKFGPKFLQKKLSLNKNKPTKNSNNHEKTPDFCITFYN